MDEYLVSQRCGVMLFGVRGLIIDAFPRQVTVYFIDCTEAATAAFITPQLEKKRTKSGSQSGISGLQK